VKAGSEYSADNYVDWCTVHGLPGTVYF